MKAIRHISCVSHLSQSQLSGTQTNIVGDTHRRTHMLSETCLTVCPRKMQNSRYLDGYILKMMPYIVVTWTVECKLTTGCNSDWSQSITDCVEGSTAIPAMFWPQEPEQLIGPNMEANNRIKWRMTSSHKVHTGASLHLPQEQLHNTHTDTLCCSRPWITQYWKATWVMLHQ